MPSLNKVQWTPLQDLVSTGQTVSDAFNDAFGKVDDIIDTVEIEKAKLDLITVPTGGANLGTLVTDLSALKENSKFFTYHEVGGAVTVPYAELSGIIKLSPTGRISTDAAYVPTDPNDLVDKKFIEAHTATIALNDAGVKLAYENNGNTNAFTDAMKLKLAGLVGTLFRGAFKTMDALETANPTADSGAYAYISVVGSPESLVIWDDTNNHWRETDSSAAKHVLDEADILRLFLLNPNTNALTDAMKAKLDNITIASGVDLVAMQASVAAMYSYTQVDGLLSAKVDKILGKELSTNDFTDGDKAKVDALTGSGTIDLATVVHQHTLDAALALKVDKVNGMGLSANDFTDTLKTKLDGLSGTGGTGGTGLSPADQEKLDHLTATKDLNLDNLAHDVDVVVQRTRGIDAVTGIATDPDYDNKQDHIEVAVPMSLQVQQQIPALPAVALASKQFMTIGSVFAMMTQLQSKTMMDKGSITNINAIVETGIYEGTDVVNSPITGEIMVMANKDAHGDFAFFLMGDDRTMHTGGKKVGGQVGWQQVKHHVQTTGEIQVKTAGGFTTIQTNTYTNISGTVDLQDGKEHVVTFVMATGETDIPNGDPAWGYILPHVADATGQPTRMKMGSASNPLGGTPNGTLKLWIDKGALVSIKKTDPANIESEWQVTHVEIPANGGASDVIHADGHIPMSQGYVPTVPKSVADKEYVDNHTSVSFTSHGLTVPDNADGKNGDVYFQYPSAKSETLLIDKSKLPSFNGTSASGFSLDMHPLSGILVIPSATALANLPTSGDLVSDFIELYLDGIKYDFGTSEFGGTTFGVMMSLDHLFTEDVTNVSTAELLFLKEGTGEYDQYVKTNGHWVEHKPLSSSDIESISFISHGMDAPDNADGKDGDVYFRYLENVDVHLVLDSSTGVGDIVYNHGKVLYSDSLSGYSPKALEIPAGIDMGVITRADNPNDFFEITVNGIIKPLPDSIRDITADIVELDWIDWNLTFSAISVEIRHLKHVKGEYNKYVKQDGEWIEHKPLPDEPTADGEYVLKVTGGVASWGFRSASAPKVYDAYLLGSSVNADVTLSIYHKFDGTTEETRNAGVDLTDGQEYFIQVMYQAGLTDAHILDSVNIFSAESFANQEGATKTPKQLYGDAGNPILGQAVKAWVNSGATIMIKHDSVFGGLKATTVPTP